MTNVRWNKLSNLSAYSRADPRLCQQTLYGAVVTLAGVALALVLLVSEVKQCMTVRRLQELQVDTTRNELLHITFNLTFPALPCETVAMDVQDVSGKFQSDAGITKARNGEVHKWQVDSEGRRLHMKEYIAPSASFANQFMVTIDETDMESMKQALQRHEGCNVYGWVEVPRVAGNLHFSVRPEAMLLSMNTHELIEALTMRHLQLHGPEPHSEAARLNASHIIHTFNFGPCFPGQHNPLDGMRRVDRKATGIDKYFVKVVPTDYHSLYGWKLHTQQYSVTEYYHRLGEFEQAPPAVYFLYDMSPIMMVFRETRPGLLRLLVRLCAVVGGVFAVTGLWDKLVHAAVKAALRRKGDGQKRL